MSLTNNASSTVGLLVKKCLQGSHFNSHCCASEDLRPGLVKTEDKEAEVSPFEFSSKS